MVACLPDCAVRFQSSSRFYWCCCCVGACCLGLLDQKQAASSMEAANKKNTDNLVRTHRSLKNAEVVAAMGMLPYLQKSWRNQQDEVLIYQTKASSVSGVFTAATKLFD